MPYVGDVFHERIRESGAFGSSMIHVGTEWFINNVTGQILSTTHYNKSVWGGERQITLDQKNPGPPYKRGGAFTSYRSHDESQVVKGYTRKSGVISTFRQIYLGGFIPVNWPDGAMTADLMNTGQSGKYSDQYSVATSLGAEAWNKYKPKQSDADLGVFLGEAKDIPRMLRTTASSFKDLYMSMTSKRTGHTMSGYASNQLLNTQFGWIPFIHDLETFIKTYRTCERRLRQLRRDNGKWIRRGGRVSSGVDNQSVLQYSSGGPGTFSSYVYPQIGAASLIGKDRLYTKSRIYKELTVDTWFVGAFRYWVPSYEASPETDRGIRKLENVLRLYGARVNPLLIWNLTPWSWLADWTTNIGDVISNYTSMTDDNLTARYAYIMQKTYDQYVNVSEIYWNSGVQTCTWSRGCEAKTRRTASPFGFSIDVPDFTVRQWSILTALGIQKKPLLASLNRS